MNLFSSTRSDWNDANRESLCEVFNLGVYEFHLIEKFENKVLSTRKMKGVKTEEVLAQVSQGDLEVIEIQSFPPILKVPNHFSLWEELFPYPFCYIGPQTSCSENWGEAKKSVDSLAIRLSRFEIACLYFFSSSQSKLILIHFVQKKMISIKDGTETLPDLILEFSGGHCSSQSLGSRFKTQSAFYAVDLETQAAHPALRIANAIDQTLNSPRLSIEFNLVRHLAS